MNFDGSVRQAFQSIISLSFCGLFPIVIPYFRLLLSISILFFIVTKTVLAGSYLHHNVTVDSETITLKDLFDNCGSNADRIILKAPAPGQKIILDSDMIQTIAIRNHVDWRQNDLFEQVVIERLGTAVTEDQIGIEVLNKLHQTQGITDSQIEWDTGHFSPVYIPLGMKAIITLHDLHYDEQSQRFDVMIHVSTSNTPSSNSRMRLSGRLFTIIEVPVINHSMSKGEVISLKDLSWIKIRQNNLRRDTITSVNQIVGMASKNSLRTNQFISPNDIQHPQLVQKGALVTMILKNGGLMLSAQGRAVEGGSIGDVIHVSNTHSNTIIEAVIDGPNHVNIMQNNAIAMAN